MPEEADRSVEDRLSVDDETELYVGSLYRGLGYNVEHDCHIQGNQIDLVARQNLPGYGEIRMIIEVKYRGERPVSKADVLRFRDVARSLIDAGHATRAVMVSTTGFTRQGRESVRTEPNIDLVSVRDLERNFLDVESGLRRFLTNYESTPINTVYVDLAASLKRTHPASGNRPTRTTKVRGLRSIAEAQPNAAVLLFADYGAGKTTALERIKADAAHSFLRDPENRIPMLFSLKNFDEIAGLDAYVQSSYKREYGFDIDPSVFWDLAGRSRFLFLLDGFDEITLKADTERRIRLLQALAPLLFGSSPAVMSSRPSYFIDASEYESALERIRTAGGLNIGGPRRLDAPIPSGERLKALTKSLHVQIQPTKGLDLDPAYMCFDLELLSSQQIDEFLEHHRDRLAEKGISSPREVRQFLDNVYDLSDLISRPIILNMVLLTILHGEIDIAQSTLSLGPSDLYEAYTALKLQLDYEKADSRQELVTPEERRTFAESCAIFMRKSDSLEINKLDVPKVDRIWKSRDSRSPKLTDQVFTDLRTCSFLTTNENGSLRFIHRSFFEFFLARAIKHEFDSGSGSMLLEPLPWEVLYFFGAFAFGDDDFRLRMADFCHSSAGSTTKRTAVTNVATAYLHSRELARNLEWSGVAAGPIKQERIRFGDCAFTDCRITGTTARLVSFENCSGSVALEGGFVESLTLDGVSGSLGCKGSVGSLDVLSSDCSVESSGGVGAIKFASSKVRLNNPTRREKGTSPTLVSLHMSDSDVDVRGHLSFQLRVRQSQLVMHDDEIADVRGGLVGSKLFVRDVTFAGLTIQAESSLLVVTPDSPDGWVSNRRWRPPQDGYGAPLIQDSVMIVPSDLRLDARWGGHKDTTTCGGTIDRIDEWPTTNGILFRALLPEEDIQSKEICRLALPRTGVVVVEGRGTGFVTLKSDYDKTLNRRRHGYPGNAVGFVEELEAVFHSRFGEDPDIRAVFHDAMKKISGI